VKSPIYRHSIISRYDKLTLDREWSVIIESKPNLEYVVLLPLHGIFYCSYIVFGSNHWVTLT